MEVGNWNLKSLNFILGPVPSDEVFTNLENIRLCRCSSWNKPLWTLGGLQGHGRSPDYPRGTCVGTNRGRQGEGPQFLSPCASRDGWTESSFHSVNSMRYYTFASEKSASAAEFSRKINETRGYTEFRKKLSVTLIFKIRPGSKLRRILKK